jgi:uncharacterized RDD family membrane protein YckC
VARSRESDGGALRDIERLQSLDVLNLPEPLVTGEAVELDLRAASFASRALGLLLDLAVIMVLIISGTVALNLLGDGLDSSAAQAMQVALIAAALVGYPVLVETATRGRSLGKLAAGLRVVRDDGGPVRFRQCLVRGLLAVLEIFIMPFIALIASLCSNRGKRLGDQLAGTFAIRTRTPGRRPEPPAMPVHLAVWAANTDLGRIPDPLTAAIRGFLQRYPTLHPAIRPVMARQLADALAGYVAPAPPAGTWPEAFLAAVLAERRARDLARLHVEEQRRRAREFDRSRAPVLSPAGTSLVGDAPTGEQWPQRADQYR